MEFNLRQKIFLKTAAPFLQWAKPEEPPVLGPDFAACIERNEEAVKKQKMLIHDWLNEQSNDDLATKFDENGLATEGEAKRWQGNRYTVAANSVKDFRPIVAATFGAPRLMADFNHWSMAAFFELEEALWLSFGLEPNGQYNGKKVAAVSQRPELDLIDIFVERRRELLRREFNPAVFGRRIHPADLYVWIKRVGLEVHQGFERMLLKMQLPEAPYQTADDMLQPGVAEKQKRPDEREKRSLAKLLVAIAIQEYGYRPDQARSPIPKEMQDIADGLGLTVSRDTILKYLRLGASELPDDWRAGRD